MAIRLIKKGFINCDKCGELLASIESTLKVYAALDEEAPFTKILCGECQPDEAQKEPMETELPEKP